MGILGGTFDPVHIGHLHAALEIQQRLKLSHVRFIPCQQPVHKEKVIASAHHRLKMLELATALEPSFIVDAQEIERKTPSYSIETLRSLRAAFPQSTLALLLGSDAFLSLNTWHEWKQLLDYCHIIVMIRPRSQLILNDIMQDYFDAHCPKTADFLESTLAGYIQIQPITALDISATMIREQLNMNLSPRFLLPEPVLAYINEQNLYREKNT
jgi:nicotinate-nucleotide adenylyltransferase